jgi:hypothetical protein
MIVVTRIFELLNEEVIMKRIIPFLTLLLLGVSMTWAQTYPTVSIHDLQFVAQDTLLKCDTLGINAGLSGWTKQTSAYYLSHTNNVRDTIEIVGQVVVPPKIIAFTGPATPFPGPTWNGAGAYNILLRDTSANATSWNSIFVRPAAAADTVALYNAGFLGLNVGDIIRLRGYIDEFPSGNMASYTQLVPIAQNFVLTTTMPNGPLEILGHKPVPPPLSVTPALFMNGSYPSGKVMFSTGEPLEESYVQMTNLKVSAIVNSTNGTFAMQDVQGNEIAMLDASMWFTLRVHRNAASTYAMPSIGQVVDTIRGYISTNSGSESARGYRINPAFVGDIVFGPAYPGFSTHRRNPVALTSTDTAVVSIKAFGQAGGSGVKTVVLNYSLNNGPWIPDTMTGPAVDSSWTGKIMPKAADTYVRYFCAVVDSLGRSSMYANAAGGSSFADTTQGFFFYTVLNRPYTIHDVQYTPFNNGYSGLLGAVVTINGVVTADTSDLSLTSSGTTPWYIQNGNAPWNGIWVSGVDTLLSKVHDGDSISVTGTVQEYLNGTTGSVGRVTRIGNASAVTVLSTGNILPAPIVLTTGAFNASNGSPTAEPYEGMAVRFNNVTVTDTFPTFADPSEYTINDGSGPVIVRAADGKSRYSNVRGDTAYGKTILHVGDKFSFMQGIIYFSFNQYKFVPRGNADFGTYTVGVIRVGNTVPEKFVLSQNYPNPFNPSTRIEYDIPRSGAVSLKIYNILGQEVATLVNSTLVAGHYSVQFNASRLPSGMYLYRLQSASGVMVRKMLLVK